MSKYTNEIEKRRTFAIISHPDAGKTTLTEKFLLYGGAIIATGSQLKEVLLLVFAFLFIDSVHQVAFCLVGATKKTGSLDVGMFGSTACHVI